MTSLRVALDAIPCAGNASSTSAPSDTNISSQCSTATDLSEHVVDYYHIDDEQIPASTQTDVSSASGIFLLSEVDLITHGTAAAIRVLQEDISQRMAEIELLVLSPDHVDAKHIPEMAPPMLLYPVSPGIASETLVHNGCRDRCCANITMIDQSYDSCKYYEVWLEAWRFRMAYLPSVSQVVAELLETMVMTEIYVQNDIVTLDLFLQTDIEDVKPAVESTWHALTTALLHQCCNKGEAT